MRFDWITRVSLDNLRPLLSLFSADLAIDLGTVNTRVYARDRGIVVNEPSAVALDNRTGEVQAVGKEAKEMLGRTPSHIRVVKPLKDGVIADFKVTEKMLSYFIQKAHQRRTLVHPRIVISIPSEVTQVEKRAVTDAAYRTKAAEVHLVEQAMMAANWRRSARYQTGRQHGGGHRRWDCSATAHAPKRWRTMHSGVCTISPLYKSTATSAGGFIAPRRT